MNYLSSVYFVSQPLHVSGIFVEMELQFHLILVNRQSTEEHMYQLLYMYSIPPDDGLQTCPKHAEVA